MRFLSKGAELIADTLKPPCCPPVTEVILGARENDFTRSVRGLLMGIDRRKWRKSLQRAIVKITSTVNDPCCALLFENDFNPDTEDIVPDEQHDCGEEVQYLGGQTFPRIIEIDLGTGIGIASLDFEAFNIPDKFIVFFDGIEVINTEYRGNAGQQGALTSNLATRGLPNETIAGVGAGTATFNKDTTTNLAYVYVYAPLPNTQWNFTLHCPV